MHAAKAQESLGTTIPWLVDAMDNRFKHAMGDRPNSEFIIGPDGTIVRMRDWSNADARKDLAELVGPIENPTDPRSLNLTTDFGRTEVARGVVKRVQREAQMTAVKVETKAATHPAYIKLRAEVDAPLQKTGRGQLYLGFFVDPIHEVHWNNQAGVVVVEVNGQSFTGPVVEAKADADPREFVIDVAMKTSIEVKLKYVACDDQETWCKQLTQTFVVTREVDPDAGRVQAGGRGNGRAPGAMRPGGRRQPGRTGQRRRFFP
ncbi:MAG: hypothetical protein R3C53_24570 [Pirellulaceae bacterium]